MRIEYYSYYPIIKKYGIPHIGIFEIRRGLASHIKRELIQHPGFNNRLSVETRKEHVVAHLDKVMKVKRNHFSRHRHIEVTEDNIDEHNFFFIDVRSLDWGKQIKYEFNSPVCKVETCPWGSKRTSPTRLRARSIRNLDLGRIWDIWDMTVRFVISERLKDLFTNNGITGLKYERCMIEDERGKQGQTKVFEGRYYVAEIAQSISQNAERIYLHDYCKLHGVITSFAMCDPVIRANAILSDDFQMINRLSVKEKAYYFRTPDFFISRKVLKLLLENEVTDLRKRGTYFGKPFVQVPIVETEA